LQIERRRLADLEANVLVTEFLESLELGRHFVRPRDDAADEVSAVGGAHRLAEHAGVLILDYDHGARHRRRLRVEDPATNLCRPLLRECTRGTGEQAAEHAAQHT
jgi:hypothetical protein